MLGCNVYSDGSAAAIDTWNPSGTKTNELDNDQVNDKASTSCIDTMSAVCNVHVHVHVVCISHVE